MHFDLKLEPGLVRLTNGRIKHSLRSSRNIIKSDIIKNKETAIMVILFG